MSLSELLRRFAAMSEQPQNPSLQVLSIGAMCEAGGNAFRIVALEGAAGVASYALFCDDNHESFNTGDLVRATFRPLPDDDCGAAQAIHTLRVVARSAQIIPLERKKTIAASGSRRSYDP